MSRGLCGSGRRMAMKGSTHGLRSNGEESRRSSAPTVGHRGELFTPIGSGSSTGWTCTTSWDITLTLPGRKPWPPKSRGSSSKAARCWCCPSAPSISAPSISPWPGGCRRHSSCTAGCRGSSGLRSLRNSTRWRPRHPASCWPSGSSSAKVSIIRRWTPWYWRCRFPGKARCSSTQAACTGEHASKTDVRIIDFVNTGHPALLQMWDKRQRGYRAMGYRVAAQAISDDGASSASAGGSSTYQS